MKYEAIVTQIVKHQSQIVGPLAVKIAGRVDGIAVEKGRVQLQQDNPLVVDELVKEYAQLFGKASIEVCKDAARGLVADLSDQDIPESLR